jgi:hypothetical protein
MAFRKGAAGAEEETKRRKAERDAAQGPRVEYFKLRDEDRIVLRMLDDYTEWIYVNQHGFVPTKDAPQDSSEEQKKKWPAKMGAVCRHDPAFDFADCFICDQMLNDKNKKYWPTQKFWARALVREGFIGTQEMADQGLIPKNKIGRIAGYVDAEEEVDETDGEGKPTGKKVMRKKFVVINLGMLNFFGHLQGFGEVYGTVLDRDYSIQRKGTDLDTKYSIVALDVDPDFDLTNEATREQYEKYAKDAGIGLDDLEKLISKRASDEFYARFFDTTKTVKANEDGGSADGADDRPQGAPAEQQAKPVEAGVNAEKLQAMRARILKSGSKPS